MVHVTQMLGASPNGFPASADLLARSVEACFDCAQTCTTCADGCLAEMPSEMRVCIAKCMNCSDICATTGRVLSRPSQGDFAIALVRAVVEACVESCRICLIECSSHPDMQRCQMCADVCRRCEQVCGELLEALGSPG